MRKLIRGPTKERRLADYLICPKFYFFAIYDSHDFFFFFLNLSKDWNVPNPLWKQFIIFNLSNKGIIHLLSLPIVIAFFSFFFFCAM